MGLRKRSDRNSIFRLLIKSLAIWSVLLLLPLLLIVVGALVLTTEELLEDDHEEIAYVAERLADDAFARYLVHEQDDILRQDLLSLADVLYLVDLEEEEEGPPQGLVIRSPEGEILAISGGLRAEQFQDLSLQVGVFDMDFGWMQTLHTARHGLVVHIVSNADELIFLVIGILLMILTGTALLTPGVLVAGWYLVRTIQSHFTTLAKEVEMRSADQLTPLPTEGSFAEFRPALDSLNTLMTRLKVALGKEREFSANVAHELRTPLAVILAQSQRIKKTDDLEICQDRASEIERSAKRAAHLIDRLIQLSRAERGLGFSDQKTDAQEVLELLIAEFNRHPSYENRVVQILRPPKHLIMVDADAFGIILSNLIENALRYSPADSAIQLEQGPDGTITIRNDCDPTDTTLLADRRKRNGQGLGLGLSICRILAEQSGMDLRVFSPIPGTARGFAAQLSLYDPKQHSP